MPEAIVKTKFFHFSQNNSGGSFHVDESVAHHVIIEALDAMHANQRATDVGIYFDGCRTGQDCDCCGDRWYAKWSDDTGDDEPLIYDTPPHEVSDMFTKVGEPMCHVYYLDGTKKSYVKLDPAAT